MIRRIKDRGQTKKRIAEERRKLLQGVQLARMQWDYAREHLDEQSRKYDLLDLLERRYMFLYQMAKKQRLSALE